MHQQVSKSIEYSLSETLPIDPNYHSLYLTRKACESPLRIRSWINDYKRRFTQRLKERVTACLSEGNEKDAIRLVSQAILADAKCKITPNYIRAAQHEASIRVKAFTLNYDSDFKGNHKPDPKKDIEFHLNSMFSKYRSTLVKLAAQVPQMHPDCLTSVCIPVASHDEGPYIYQTLKSFTEQTSDNNAFEIILFANCPEELRYSEGSQKTLREITRFKIEHPEMPVHLLNATLSGTTVRTIGFARAIANDVALLRHLARSNNQDHILIRCDADTRSVHPEFIENYIALFKANPKTDAFAGQLCWSPEKFHEDPLLWASLSLYDIIVSGMRIYNGRQNIGGPNWAIRGSVYAYVSGYNPQAKFGEDLMLGTHLLELRDNYSSYIPVAYAGSKSRLYTSTRRAEVAHENTVSCLEQWSEPQSVFKDVDSVRKPRTQTKVFNPENISIKALESLINQTIKASDVFENFNAYSPGLHKALGLYLGLDFEIVNSKKIKILSTDRFIEKWKQLSEKQLLRYTNKD